MNMMKTFLALTFFGCVAAEAKAELVGDTIVFEDVNKVKIETRDTVQRIVINGMKDDPQFHYVQRISIPDSSAVRRTMKSVKDFNKITIKKKDGKPSKWDASLHLNLGVDALLGTPKGYEFKMWPAFEIGLNWLANFQPFGKHNVWSAGLAVDWRNYAYDSDHYLDKNSDGLLKDYDFNTTTQKNGQSSLLVTSLSIPVLYTHYFDAKQSFGFTVGGIVNWNYYACSRFSFDVDGLYEADDHETSVSVKKIGQRPITVDGIIIAHIPSFPDVYCKYSPMKLFKDGRGPKATQLSFGLWF